MKMLNIQPPPSSGISDAVRVLELVTDAKKTKALLQELKQAVAEFEAFKDECIFIKSNIELSSAEISLKEEELKKQRSELDADRAVVADMMAKARELEFELDKKIKEQSEKEHEFAQIVSSHQRLHEIALSDVKAREDAADAAKEEAEKASKRFYDKLQELKAVML